MRYTSKKRLGKRLLTFAVIIILVSCSVYHPALAATVDKKTYILGVGETLTKTVPEKITQVKSSNQNIVTVKKANKKKFVLKASSSGKATVTVKYGKKTLKATVKVGAKKITGYGDTISGITMNKDAFQSVSVKLSKGKKDTLQWRSSDNSVVSVASATVQAGNANAAIVDNTLLAKKAGSARITVSSKHTGKYYVFSVNVRDTVKTTPQIFSTITPPNSPVPSVTILPKSTSDGAIHTEETAGPTVTETVTPDVTGLATGSPDEPFSSGAPATPTATTSAAILPVETLAPASTPGIVEKAETAKIEDVFICAENKIQVDFTEELLDVERSDFYISGVSILSATLTGDRKSVLLKTNPLSTYYDYNMIAGGMTSSNGKIVSADTRTFSYSSIQYTLSLHPEDDCSVIKAATGEAITLTAILCNEQGKPVKDTASVYFSTDLGRVSEHLVKMENGMAQVTLYAAGCDKRQSATAKVFIYSAENKALINKTATTQIVMDPDRGTMKEALEQPYVTKIRVDSCDRILVYFNKEIDVTNYTQNTTDCVYGYDGTKLKFRIATTRDSTRTTLTGNDVYKTPMALIPVNGNPNALYAIMDTDGDGYLPDNTYVLAEITDRLGEEEVKSTHCTYVSDNSDPYITRVYNDGMRELKIEFSENIQNGGRTNSAENANHWTLDGVPFSDSRFGTSTHPATVTVGDVDLLNGTDERNVVTIALGSNHSLEPIYFVAGTHLLATKTIGDWANCTDMNHNVLTSVTETIKILSDQTLPEFQATAESPEQFYVRFNCPVEYAAVRSSVKLQYYQDNTWKTIPGATFHVEPMDEEGMKYILELTTDWTKLLDTAVSKKNYYSYDLRLYADAGAFKNLKNGALSKTLAVPLEDKTVRVPDTESPVILAVWQEGTTCIVEMNKPVQIAIASETTTPSQLQGDSVSLTTVQFVSEDNATTVSSRIYAMVDGHDTAFKVRPSQVLTPGKWKVIVRGASDDVGNTAETLYLSDFFVKGSGITSDPEFGAIWALGIPAGGNNPLTGRVETNTEDLLCIKYNGNYKTYNGTANACYAQNYIVNSTILSSTNDISSSLSGYNEDANVKNNYTDLVVIHLPKGTLTGDTVELRISKNIQSVLGEALSNYGEKILTYDNAHNYYAWKYKTYSGNAGNITKTSELQQLFDDTDYVSYNLPHFTNYNFVDQQYINISHAGTYNFDSNEFTNLEIRTKESGQINITGGIFDNVIVHAPNAEVKFYQTVVTDASSASSGKITVQEALEEHLLLNDVTAKEVVLLDSTYGTSLHTEGSTAITTVTVNTRANVSFLLNSSRPTRVVLHQPGNVSYTSNLQNEVYVEETAASLRFTKTSSSATPRLVLSPHLCIYDVITNVPAILS